jgi:hypothetical protein
VRSNFTLCGLRKSFCLPLRLRSGQALRDSFLFCELTPDLRPGLSYFAPSGAGVDNPFCVFSHKTSGAEALLFADHVFAARLKAVP